MKQLPSSPSREFYRSGNPGYQTDMPLIVDQEAVATKPHKVAEGGFRLYQHDQKGDCFDDPGSAAIYDYPSQILKFEQLTLLTCKRTLTDVELKAYCEGSGSTGLNRDSYQKLKIFKQLEGLQYVAQFGAADRLRRQDWLKVVRAKTGSAAGKKAWTDATRTCRGIVGYDVKFLYSVVGFEKHLQKYVVGAMIEEIHDDWVYYGAGGTGAAKQSFNHVLQVSFHEVLPQTLLGRQEENVAWFIPRLPADIFYPFFIGG